MLNWHYNLAKLIIRQVRVSKLVVDKLRSSATHNLTSGFHGSRNRVLDQYYHDLMIGIQ